eukprot:ANDGO_07404.mRNA.1 hypothetical protein
MDSVFRVAFQAVGPTRHEVCQLVYIRRDACHVQEEIPMIQRVDGLSASSVEWAIALRNLARQKAERRAEANVSSSKKKKKRTANSDAIVIDD